MPQNPDYIREAKDPWLSTTIEEHKGAVTPRIIQGQALLQVRPSSAELTQREQAASQRPICLHQQGRVVLPPGQVQELLPQLARHEKLASHLMKPPQPMEDREELVGLPGLLAQLSGAGIGSLHFWRGNTFDGLQRRAQREVQQEFLLGAPTGVGQRCEKL
jgi:hypothetical protein